METHSDSTSQFSIEELERATGIPVRTIRFYIARDLLPGPGSRGKQAAYGEDQLLRLQLIRLLTEQRVPLDGIRGRLAALSTDDIRALLEHEQPHAELLKRVAESPRDYIALLLERARQRDDGGSYAAPAPSARPSRSEPPTKVAEHRRNVLSAPAAMPAMPSGARAEPAVRDVSRLDPFDLLSGALTQTPDLAQETWSRYELAPGLELHERAGAAPDVARLRQRLLAFVQRTRLLADAVPSQEP